MSRRGRRREAPDRLQGRCGAPGEILPSATALQRRTHPIGDDPVEAAAAQDFQLGTGYVATAPPNFLARILLTITIAGPTALAVPLSAQRALVHEVRMHHLRALRRAKATLQANPAWNDQPLVLFLITLFATEAQVRNWCPATHHRELTNMTGAFSNLSMYSETPHNITLNRYVMWSAELRFRQQRSNATQPTNQPAVIFTELQVALAAEPRQEIVFALVLMWLTAARPGCLLQLLRSNVEFNQATNALTIRFVAGKGVLLRGPYTVHTACPPQWSQRLQAYLQQQHPTSLVVPATPSMRLQDRNACLLRALRVAHPNLSMRAMRRGSLQAMALAGATAETLMSFSGHSQEKTLKRYLDWGRLFGEQQQRAVAAAGALHH